MTMGEWYNSIMVELGYRLKEIYKDGIYKGGVYCYWFRNNNKWICIDSYNWDNPGDALTKNQKEIVKEWAKNPYNNKTKEEKDQETKNMKRLQ